MWRPSLLVLFTIFITGVSASTAGGIDLPDVRHVNGVQLKRNGHGVRSITFLGMDIKVYVAGFYSESPLLSDQEVMACPQDSPMQMDFTFLRRVGKGRVISAWMQQLEHSVSYSSYEGYENDRDNFIDMFASPIAYGGTQTVQIVGDNTVLIDQGVHKGIIAGRGFQKAFLSMWFGERAVAEDLKAGLLSGAAHEHEQPVLA
jgi:hypothetical protein